jgi:5-methyltetrahydropteroyltriglutamate--homocysteine methyltransferase
MCRDEKAEPMQRSTSRILTTHTGSLPRPRELIRLYALRAGGEAVDAAEIDRAGREAVRAIVRKQHDAGIDVGNNGEQQRDSFFLYLKARLSGLGGSWERPSRADVDRYPDFKRLWIEQHASRTQVSALGGLPKAIGEVRYLDDRAIDDECRYFNAVLADNPGVFVEPFMSAPSPGILATAVRNEHYDTLANYLAALGRALQVEYEAIVRNGLLLQIDAPDLALERHITYKDKPVAAFVAFVEEVVATINQALRNIPRDRIRLHVCWGNSESPHDCDVPLEDILPALQQANVGGFVLPFANPRHAHEFRCFAKRPLKDDQVLVAGVIDSLTNFVEHPEVVADRIERVAAVVGDPSRVLAGTDCGFDTSAGWGRVAEDVVWAKLSSLRDGARLASDRLFSHAL